MKYGPEYSVVNQLYPLGPVVVTGKQEEEIRIQILDVYRPKYLHVTESRNEVRDLWLRMHIGGWAVWKGRIAAGYFVVGDFESDRYQLDSHAAGVGDVISVYIRNCGSVARRFSGVLKGLEVIE